LSRGGEFPSLPRVTSRPFEERPDPILSGAIPTDTAATWRYASPGDSYDELFDASGGHRATWERPAAMLSRLGPAELRRRWEQARQLLHEHGVSYDAYGDPHGVARPWNLSPIPIVLGSAEWQHVARGLAQRARLLATILADLYGPQRLLLEGDLPPEIVFAHAAFLRPCVGIEPPGGRYLPLYAADLGRRPNGEVVVLADRTRAPSGAGYALENRIVLSRTLPEVFRESGVERLALFFRAMRDSLRDLAPHNRDNPRIALLTPGPYNATYFEQAFLAQYLGITLAQGADLTVRDRIVYLKTLGGLQAVDVILRRVRDDFCDPLELGPESSLGVPGLVDAVRAGNVAMANPLGSGVLQTPAVMPYLPAICRKLLAEDLLLESVPTFWCGDRASHAYVEENLPELVIRLAFPIGSGERVVAGKLPARALEELRDRIRADPRMYVAQQPFPLSMAPTLGGAGSDLTPAPLWMRGYLVATEDSYEVMPGALSRVGAPDERLALSLRVGGESKDTWILAGGPVSTFSLLKPPSASIVLSRGGADLPSRVADNLFWLGRYAERAEGTGRLARAIGTRLSEQSLSSETDLGLEALFRAMAVETGISPAPANDGALSERARTSLVGTGERALAAAIFDSNPPGTLRAVVESAYRVARTLRDRISGDMWRALVQLNHEVHERPADAGPRALGEILSLVNQILLALAAFSGLGIDSMSRGLGWRFLDAGRRLERALHIVTVLRSTLASASPQEGPILEALLEVADSSMTYRRRYLATLLAAPVVDLLLADETNPRSVLYQVRALGDHLDALPREPGAPRSPQQLILYEATASIQLADVNALCTPVEGGERPRLQALLDRLAFLLPELSNSLSGAYLNHASNVPTREDDDQ
jgi:uncharacterized circularly permuted ATP-grasp superfamily protein/uncharacterized alpha-E superfamily protein